MAVAATAPQHCVSLLGFFGAGGRFPFFHSLYDSIDLANPKGYCPICIIDLWFGVFSGFPGLGERNDEITDFRTALT
jgi:hypothetical protein